MCIYISLFLFSIARALVWQDTCALTHSPARDKGEKITAAVAIAVAVLARSSPDSGPALYLRHRDSLQRLRLSPLPFFFLTLHSISPCHHGEREHPAEHALTLPLSRSSSSSLLLQTLCWKWCLALLGIPTPCVQPFHSSGMCCDRTDRHRP